MRNQETEKVLGIILKVVASIYYLIKIIKELF